MENEVISHNNLQYTHYQWTLCDIKYQNAQK